MSTTEPRADLAQAPAPVRVKPLQFRDETGDGVLTSRETGELFRIFPQADGTFFAPKLEDGSAPDAQTLIDRLNARHAARILAALEAPDAGVVAELVGAAKALSDAYRTWSLIPRRRAGEKQAFEDMHLRKVALDAALAKLETRA